MATGDLHIWTGFSVIILLLGVALLAYQYARTRNEEEELPMPSENPLINLTSTPSMKATLKYFVIVTALILVQVIMGVVTAHFGVEGNAFYGLDLSSILPYSISRTWHVQLAIFWIATSWLATGLYIAPAVSGYEPKFQRLGVNVLFGALLVIVVGSLAGQWMGVMQKLGMTQNFWFGHMGYEYVDLGRFWQIFLFAGLFIWLALMVRPLIPILKAPSESRNLIILFVVASAAIGSFYGAGLMWGQHTNLAIAEYWRWWVVHLWVEGFFEVFAAVVSAFIFVKLGLLRIKSATTAVLFSTIIFLGGGIIGTFHHLYFTGTPTAVFSIRSYFQRTGSCSVGADGFRGLAQLQPEPPHQLAGKLQMADLRFDFRSILEPRWRWYLRIPDQSSNCIVLHAGPEHDSGSRTHRPVWRVWYAWNFTDAFCSPEHVGEKRMER